MCRVLNVNRSHYYASQQTKEIINTEQQALEQALTALFLKHRECYGSRRLVKALNQEGFSVGRYRIRRLMKKLGLVARYPKRYKATSDSAHPYPVADNVLAREFQIDAPNKVWTTDITYIWTQQSWVYLAIVMDLYSRQIVGWSVQSHMRTQLCLDALTMAWWRRRRPKSVLHHSDRGSQYASHDYQQCLQRYGMKVSMSRKGNCWDNAPTERFFRTLKSDWLHRFQFENEKQAVHACWDYITYYNSERSHYTLGYLSPMEFEQQDKRILL